MSKQPHTPNDDSRVTPPVEQRSLLSRRQSLEAGLLGAVALVGCGGSDGGTGMFGSGGASGSGSGGTQNGGSGAGGVNGSGGATANSTSGGVNGSGGTANGGAANGGTANGGTANGGTANGGAANGGSATGGTANGGTANGGAANGGAANGGTANGGAANGGAANGGTAAGGRGSGGVGSGGMISGSGGSTSCVLIPEETVGPYPLWDTLAGASAYTRKDVTEGKPGVPLTLVLKILNVSDSCKPVANALVYIWHCDKDGVYSGYGTAAGTTFCRGVQATDSSGNVTFTTIYPGWYTGRITHIHFRVYFSNNLEATSQLAFPLDVTTAVYNSDLYKAHGQNTSVASNTADGIFSDGVQYELLNVTGSVAAGYTATLNVGVAL
ncbi:MAG: intradiol ring-cleavage dioxygenase [Polyangiaceae bacterium]